MSKLIFVFALAMLALPVLAQQGNFAEPERLEVEKFPNYGRPLTTLEQAMLELKPIRISTPTVVYNHFRSLRDEKGRFVLETLPAGTLVFADKNDKIRYKADCGNRLVELVGCPTCPQAGSGRNEGKETLGGSTGPSAWSRFWDSASKAWDVMWETMGSITGFLLAVLIPFLLLLAFLFLLGYLIYRVIQDQQGRRVQNPPPPQPQPAPAQQQIPVMAPVAPPTPPQPTPAPIQLNPAPQPAPVPPAFPAGRVVIDLGDANNATRIQAGANIARVEFEEDRNNGSTSIRIFRR